MNILTKTMQYVAFQFDRLLHLFGIKPDHEILEYNFAFVYVFSEIPINQKNQKNDKRQC